MLFLNVANPKSGSSVYLLSVADFVFGFAIACATFTRYAFCPLISPRRIFKKLNHFCSLKHIWLRLMLGGCLTSCNFSLRLTFFAQCENLLIVNVWLPRRSVIAWNIDKKHTVNPLTPARQADRLCNRSTRLSEDNRGWERRGAGEEINGSTWSAHSAALHFSPPGRIRVDLH